MQGSFWTLKLVGLSGNLRRPSKTHALVAHTLARIRLRYGVEGEHLDLTDALPELGQTFEREAIRGGLARVIEAVESADALVVGSPVYKGAYAGLFKHLFDLLDPEALKGAPVLITATGGGERHALVVEQALRPLFGFFMAHAMPTAVYASSRDFEGDRVTAPDLVKRIDDAVDELAPFLVARRLRARRLQAADPHGHDDDGAFDRIFA